jgi:exonuclease III
VLKIVTWNANDLVTDHETKLEDLGKLLENEGPDLVCLQEVCIRDASEGKSTRTKRLVAEDLVRGRLQTMSPFSQFQLHLALMSRTIPEINGQHVPVAGGCALRKEVEYADVVCSFHRALPLCLVDVNDANRAPKEKHVEAFANKHDKVRADEPAGRLIYARFPEFDLMVLYVPSHVECETERGQRSYERRVRFEQITSDFLELRKLLTCRELLVGGDVNSSLNPKLMGDKWDKLGRYGFDLWCRTHGLAYRAMRHGSAIAAAPNYLTFCRAEEDAKVEGRSVTKRDRVDSFFASAAFCNKHAPSCTILGRVTYDDEFNFQTSPEQLRGRGFMGSDHSPVLLTLRPRADAGADAANTQPASSTLYDHGFKSTGKRPSSERPK